MWRIKDLVKKCTQIENIKRTRTASDQIFNTFSPSLTRKFIQKVSGDNKLFITAFEVIFNKIP